MKSEFAGLYELVLGRGVENSVLLDRIKTEVLTRYRERYPKGAIGAEVLIDTASGLVRLVTGDEDVTPPKFGEEAAGLARQILIGYLGEVPQTKKPKSFKLPGALANLFFWGYNLYFGLFNLLLVWGYLGAGWKTVWQMGAFKILMWLIVVATPLTAMITAVKNKLYRTPGSLLKLFFLFELPLVVAAFVPLSMVAYTTLFVSLVTILALTIPGILYMYEKGDLFSDNWLKVRLFVEQFAAMMGGYLVLLFTFFAPVIIGGIAKSLWPGRVYPYLPSPEPIIGSLLQLGLGAVILLIVSALVLVPFALELILVKAFLKTANKMPGYAAIFAAVIVTISAAAAYQPGNTWLLSALRQVAAAPTFEEREKLARTILTNEEKAKQVILDSQYGRSRYLFTADDTSLESEYKNVLNFSDIPAEAIQRMFLTLAYPFVYQGERDLGGTLTNNFKYVFGYWSGEGKLQPTPTPFVTNNVLLTYRKMSVSPSVNGLLATVTVEEEYDNTTYRQQEVIYEFNLPVDAVVTDLRLGPNLEFPGVIAPKGAVQRTYEQELNKQRDPALLEQTGPRQYRLRVFPIPAKNDFSTLAGKRQKVQYSYVIGVTPQGYPLPEITRKTNVFSNAGSALTFKENEKFAPAAVDPCRGQFAQTSLIVLPCEGEKEVLQAISGARIAIFYDVSAANKDDKGLEEIKKVAGADVYKYNDTLSEKTTADALDPVYFGTSDVWKALALFKENYDLAIIVTTYNDAWPENVSFPFGKNTNVYIVHTLGIPAYNLKLTSRLWQSRGDVVSSVDEALKSFTREKRAGPTQSTGEYLSAAASGMGTDKNALTQYLNKVFLRSIVWNTPVDVTGDITILDKLNEYAVQANIVTPYSSALALVNEQQQNLLEQFKKGYNRYQDQPVTENIAPGPMRIVNPMMELSPLEAIRAPTFGALNGTSMMSIDGGGGGVAPISSGLGLFVIANGLLLAGGLGFYLFKLLRKRG